MQLQNFVQRARNIRPHHGASIHMHITSFHTDRLHSAISSFEDVQIDCRRWRTLRKVRFKTDPLGPLWLVPAVRFDQRPEAFTIARASTTSARVATSNGPVPSMPRTVTSC